MRELLLLFTKLPGLPGVIHGCSEILRSTLRMWQTLDAKNDKRMLTHDAQNDTLGERSIPAISDGNQSPCHDRMCFIRHNYDETHSGNVTDRRKCSKKV